MIQVIQRKIKFLFFYFQKRNSKQQLQLILSVVVVLRTKCSVTWLTASCDQAEVPPGAETGGTCLMLVQLAAECCYELNSWHQECDKVSLVWHCSWLSWIITCILHFRLNFMRDIVSSSLVSWETSSIVSINMADPLLVRAVYKFKGTNNDEVKVLNLIL